MTTSTTHSDAADDIQEISQQGQPGSTDAGPDPVWPNATGRGRRLARRIQRRMVPALTVTASAAVLVFLWDLWVNTKDVAPTVFPAPRKVWDAFWHDLTTGLYFDHGWITLQEVLLGFAIGSAIGFVLALAIAESRILRRVVYPFIIMSQNVPKVALAPLFVVWFGFGLQSKVAMAISITFFPVLVNSLAGFDSIERAHLDLMRVSKARRLSVLWWLKLPYALPSVFAGLELAIVFSVIGAVVAEFTGAAGGLGYLVLAYNQRLEVAREFGVLLALAILGYTLHAIVRFAGHRAVFWRHDRDRPLGA